MGVKQAMSLPLQDRIRFANRMGVIIAVMGFLLAGVYLSMGRKNTEILVIMGLFGLSVPILNWLGAHLLTRILISIAPATTIIVFDISLKISKPENLEIISYITPRYVVLCSMMLPLALFVYKERWLRNIIVLLLIALVFNFDTLFYLTGTHFTQIRPELISRTYKVQWINMAIVTATLLTTTSFLLYANKKNEDAMQFTLAETQATNLRLKESEAALKESLEAMQKSKLELEKQNWISASLAHFLQILREEKSFDELCQVLLSNIATYTKAQQGAFYWLNQTKATDLFLELRATYALSVGKAQKNVIPIHEGLVGAVFIRQQYLHLKEIPETHTHSFSGLGAGKPQELLIIPLVFHGKSVGIIELATFYTFESHQIALMQQVSEAIATTLNNFELSKRADDTLNELQRFKSKISYL